VVLMAAGTSSYSTEPTAASGARGKIRASTSAMRHLRSDPGAVDRFGDAIGREPVRCWVMIHEAQILFPSGDFRPGASRYRPFVVCVGGGCWRHGCQSCDLCSASINKRGAAGWCSPRQDAGEIALVRRHVVCGSTPFGAISGRS
jgi:hypothetical protein